MKEYPNWEWVWIKNNVKQKMSNRSKPIQGQKETNLPWNLNWVYAEWEYSKEHRRLERKNQNHLENKTKGTPWERVRVK